MAFESRAKEFGRELIHVVEITRRQCSLTYGSGTCSAGRRRMELSGVSGSFQAGDEIEGGTSGTLAIVTDSFFALGLQVEYEVFSGVGFSSGSETITNNTRSGSGTKTAVTPTEIFVGDNKCFNTLTTCQVTTQYDETLSTFRCCEPRSPHPFGIAAIPNIESVNTTPTEINLGGGFGQSSSLEVTFNDHPHSDIGFDDYLADRTYDPNEVGTFWTKYRARNAFYENDEVKLLTGFIVNNTYNVNDFETRTFLLKDLTVSNGTARLKAGDVLSRITEKKPLAPSPSVGTLSADITDSATSFTVNSGEGADYSAGGHVLIDNEVVSFTRSSDTFTITRAQYNTTAAEHSQDATVQECLIYSAQQVNLIVEDLLTTYGNIPSSYINSAQWQAEADNYLTTNAAGIIVKPTEVDKLIKELGEQFPHSLYWDDKLGKIGLLAIRAPSDTTATYTQDGNIIDKSFRTRDKRDKQISTVYVRFNQIDPTKNLDEPANYSETYARVNVTAISRYESNKTMTINSRWISSKGSAIRLATLHGRRFGFTLRECDFQLDMKDSNLTLGSVANVQHRDIVDFNGYPRNMLVQIISAAQGERYKYKGLEYIFDDALPGDLTSSTAQTLITLNPFDENNDGGVRDKNNGRDVNLREVFEEEQAVAPTASTDVIFILQSGYIINVDTVIALRTGSWPAGATVTLQIDESAAVVGRGGDGADSENTNGGDGDNGIFLDYDLTLINNGIIGAGGGGGATTSSGTSGPFTGPFIIYGGGGASYGRGLGGGSSSFEGIELGGGEDGGLLIGGAGQVSSSYEGGDGGNLGQPGGASSGGVSTSSPGAAGAYAIDRNGNTLTTVGGIGDVRGNDLT